MARDTCALNLWHRIVSWAYDAGDPIISVFISLCLEFLRVWFCSWNAADFSARSSWLYSTPLPDDCYLSSHVNILLQLVYIFATLETVLSPVCTIVFCITIIPRETVYTKDILFLRLTAISIVVAAVVLALQTLVLNSSLDVQAILRIRPDLSSEDVLATWESLASRGECLTAFIFFLLSGGFQLVAVSAQHLISSPKRLPKQFRPFVVENHQRTSAIGDLESLLGSEVVAVVDSGPLARLYDHCEKQGLISDLEYLGIKHFDEEERYRAFQECRTDDGPQFVLFDRYWVSRMEMRIIKSWIMIFTVYFLVAVSFEIARFASTLRSEQPCQCLCVLGIIYPWPFAICFATFLISVQSRFALQRKVFGIIRIDRLLTICFKFFLIPATVYALARVIAIDNESTSLFILWDIIILAIGCFFILMMLLSEIEIM